MIHDNDEDDSKIATKGVHADDQLKFQDFVDSLYMNTYKSVKQVNFRVNKKLDRMALLDQQKKP